jgi:hypothetical protein
MYAFALDLGSAKQNEMDGSNGRRWMSNLISRTSKTASQLSSTLNRVYIGGFRLDLQK